LKSAPPFLTFTHLAADFLSPIVSSANYLKELMAFCYSLEYWLNDSAIEFDLSLLERGSVIGCY
jgi:hypothetical protein